MRVRYASLSAALALAATSARANDSPSPSPSTQPEEALVPAAVPAQPGLVFTETATLPRERLVAGTTVAPSSVEPAVPDAFRPSVYVGGALGIGAPGGLLGGFVGVQPVGFASIEAAAGWGGAFGPSLAAGVRLYPLRGHELALSVAGFYSNNYTPAPAVSVADPNDPTVSHWASAEIAGEFRHAPGFGLRVAAGWTWLLNGGDFGNPTDPQAVFHTTGPFVDLPDARANARAGQGTSFLYLHLDVFYCAPL